jgi:hypothetical protein
MEFLKYVEYAVIAIIIGLQILVFIKIVGKMAFLKTAIPNERNFKMLKAYLPLTAKCHSISGAIRWFNNHYEGENVSFGETDIHEEDGLLIGGDIMLVQTYQSQDFINRLLFTLNTYLIKNKGAAADFHLIKDLVERNVDLEEQEVEVMTPIPLYLGLGGTMFGIIIGLFGMPEVSGQLTDATEQGIDALFQGVKIAMIASLSGLVFTTISSWMFRSTKTEIERRKNGFYTFVQSQLLPVLSKSLQSSTQGLKDDFVQFNEKFHGNIEKLSRLVQQNFSSFEMQNQTLAKLESIDLNKLAMANVMTFQHLEESMTSLKSLGMYIASMETFLHNTTALGDKVNGLLDRTNDIELIAAQVRDVFEDNKQLQGFLLSHFQTLHEHGDVIQRSVSDSDNRMKEVVSKSAQVQDRLVKEIQEATESNVTIVKEKLISQYNELEKITLQNPQFFKKLEHLESVDKNLSNYLKTSTSVQTKMLKRLELIERTVIGSSREVSSGKGGSGYELLPLGIQRFIPAFELSAKILGFLTIVFVFIAIIKYLFF